MGDGDACCVAWNFFVKLPRSTKTRYRIRGFAQCDAAASRRCKWVEEVGVSWCGGKNVGLKSFDGLQKAVLEFKALLIAAGLVGKEVEASGADKIFKNIQPISVGV